MLDMLGRVWISRSLTCYSIQTYSIKSIISFAFGAHETVTFEDAMAAQQQYIEKYYHSKVGAIAKQNFFVIIGAGGLLVLGTFTERATLLMVQFFQKLVL